MLKREVGGELPIHPMLERVGRVAYPPYVKEGEWGELPIHPMLIGSYVEGMRVWGYRSEWDSRWRL